MTMTTEKVHQFGSAGDPIANINYTIGALGFTVVPQRIHRHIKDSLLRVPLFPWTIVKCCNGSSVGAPGQDLWTSDGAIVGGTGNHSWIVYEQVALGTHFQLCFDLNNAYETYCTVVTSMGGFNDNGAVNSRPTASDERVHQSATTFLVQSYSWGGPCVVNVSVSTDGECTRIWVLYNGFIMGFLLLDKPKLPEVGWVDPYLYICYSASSNCAIYDTLNKVNSFTHSRFNGVNVNYYLGTIFFAINCMGEYIGGQNDQLLEWECYPVWLCSGNDSDRRGTKGMLYDFWFGTQSAGITTGDVYPVGGPYTHIALGDIVLPWPDVVPLTS